MLNSPSKKQVLLSPLIDLLQKDSILTEHTVVIDPERILKRAANYHIQQKDIHSYVSEFKKINSIQKENTFLCQIQQQPYQQTQPTFINSIFSASNTPKK